MIACKDARSRMLSARYAGRRNEAGFKVRLDVVRVAVLS